MEDKYISIQEFAEIVGISKQAVYKQVDKKLNNYIKRVDRRIMLNIKALKDVYGVEVENIIQPNQPKVETVEQPNQPDNQPKNDAIYEVLMKQIEVKDHQIEELQKALNHAQQLLDQEQQLHLMTKQKIAQLEELKKEVVEQPEPEKEEKKSFWSRWFKF